VARGAAEARTGSLGDPARDRAADTILTAKGTARNTSGTSGLVWHRLWPRGSPASGSLAADELTTSDIDGVTHLLSARANSVSEDTLARPLELLECVSSRHRLTVRPLAVRSLATGSLTVGGLLLVLLVPAAIAPLLQPRTSLTELTDGPFSSLLGKATNLAPKSSAAMTAATTAAIGVPRGPALTMATIAAMAVSARPAIPVVFPLGLRLLGLLTSDFASLASFAPLTDP